MHLQVPIKKILATVLSAKVTETPSPPILKDLTTNIPQKIRTLKKNTLQSNKVVALIITKMIPNNIEELESNCLKIFFRKIQNRLSARRVRGRKQDAFDTLEQEVDYLRKINSQLQLSNARLQTENKSLKDQIQFMKGLVKHQNINSKTDPIQKYLNDQVLVDKDTTSIQGTDFESPFMEDESDWLRLPNRRNSSNSWAMLAVFTLILAVFILPSDTTVNSPTILFSVAGQKNEEKEVVKLWSQVLYQGFVMILNFTKAGLKYLIVFGYVWFLYKVCQKYMKSKKMKKV